MMNSSHHTQSEACSCGNDGRNLVVCIDGTSNDYGENITNVLKLYRRIDKKSGERDQKPHQLAYYHSGIGTHKRSLRASLSHYAKVFARPIDLAVALNFENTIVDAYHWLSDVYKDGDRIFFFGFSRGAYQVRTLSAMIAKVGLIHSSNEWQIPLAYQLYADADNSPNAAKATHKFKDVFSRDVKVHFVGAWDTVSSVGITRGLLLPQTIDGMTHVCYFRHALALDELRVKFLPEYANGGKRPLLPNTVSLTYTDTKEVWFAGSHSDVGGKGRGGDDLGPALTWMLAEAKAAGLRLNLPQLFNWKPDDYKGREIHVNKSLTKWYWLPELLPLRRLTYGKDSNGKDTSYWPHCGKGRVILDGQQIHPSVWMARNLGTVQYNPRARLQETPDVDFWGKLKGGNYVDSKGTVNQWKEVYLDSFIPNLVQQYFSVQSMTQDEERLQKLRDEMYTSAKSAEGWRLLGREIYSRMALPEPLPTDRLCKVFHVLIESAKGHHVRSTPGLGKYTVVRPHVLRHLQEGQATNEQYGIARQCMLKHTFRVQGKCLHLSLSFLDTGSSSTWIDSVAFSPDGTRVVSGSRDGIQVWDKLTPRDSAGTTQGPQWTKQYPGKPEVYFAGFSRDNERIVSGSKDGTVRIWDVRETAPEPDQADQESSKGYDGPIVSAVFSSNGKLVVSRLAHAKGSVVRLWDVEKSTELSFFEGPGGGPHSVALSADGTRIAWGSADAKVRLWKVEVRQMRRLNLWGSAEVHVRLGDAAVGKALETFEGHTSAVRSVALSANGKRIVSGSADSTIRLWEEGKKEPLSLFEGHTGAVRSVALSHDGKYIISGSADKTVRIWDVEKGEISGDPYKGHTASVSSVAFSADGKRFVSGSDDGTVRVWDVLQEPF